MNSILYVSPFAYAVSGADESLLTIVRRLSRDSFSPHVALPHRSPYKKRFQESGVPTYSLPILRLKRTLNPLYWMLFLFWQPIEVFFLSILIVSKRIRLVHINMESTLSAAVAAKICRRPVVFHYRGKVRENPKLFFDLFLPLLHTLSNHTFVISKAVAHFFEKRNLTKNVEVLYNAIDLTPFNLKEDRDFFLRRDVSFKGKKVIAFLGRFDPQKRIADLIEAAGLLAAKRNDFAVAILGGDLTIPEEIKHREELLHFHQTQYPAAPVHFLGRELNVPHVLQSSDLFVLPAIDEGFGRVVIEAMAAGTPVIVADSGAPPELIKQGQFGCLVPARKPDQLARAIEEFLRDPAPAKALAEKAQKHARDHFDISGHVGRLVEVYDELLPRS